MSFRVPKPGRAVARRWRAWLVVGTVFFAGCTDGALSSSPPDDTPTETVDSHPDGRIVFGRITRLDPVYGQVVALHAADPDGGNIVRLTEDDTAYPAWSPDGTRIAFSMKVADGSVQIATMAPDGSDVRVLTSGPGVRAWPSWSPDGTWLVYGYSPTLPDPSGFRTVIYRMEADGSDQRLLGEEDTFDRDPRISPDGAELLFVRDDDGVNESVLVVRDLATGEERTITAAGTAADHPNWSPDGAWIVYNVAGWRTGDLADEHVYRVRADGSGERVAVTNPSLTRAAFKPAYSPDGSRLVIGCIGEADDDALCLVNPDGSDFIILIDEHGVAENHFSWGIAG